MRLLAIARPVDGAGDIRAAIAKHAQAELRAVWQMYVDGFARELYSPGGPGIVMVLESPDAEQARAKLAELPLAANRVVEFEVIELHPFAAIQMLFAQD